MDRFAVDFDFQEIESQAADDPTTLLGVRYTIGGEDIVPDDDTGTPYTRDYLPDLLRKWLHYVRSLSEGEERTFEFTEYSDVQFRLRPDGDTVELTVTKRHRDTTFGTYVLDLEQLAEELLEATARYREWLLNQNPDLASADAIRELRDLSETVSEEVLTPDDTADP